MAAPLTIAIATALLVLAILYGAGGFLASRIVPSSAGRLVLPAVPAPAIDAPEASPAKEAPAEAGSTENANPQPKK